MFVLLGLLLVFLRALFALVIDKKNNIDKYKARYMYKQKDLLPVYFCVCVCVCFFFVVVVKCFVGIVVGVFASSCCSW
jgi:hypothetical protein